MFRRVWGLKPGCWVDVPCTVGVHVPSEAQRLCSRRDSKCSAGRPENALQSLEPLPFGAEQGRGEVPRAPKLHVSALEIAGLPELRFQGRVVVIGGAGPAARCGRRTGGA